MDTGYDRVAALFGADAVTPDALYGPPPRRKTGSPRKEKAFFFETHAELGKRIAFDAPDAAALRATAEPYVDSSAASADGALWPLVRKVRLEGPWAALARGATLVDAPGLRDDNSARDATVKSALRAADALWFVSNVRRAVNDKTVRDCLTTTFRESLARDRSPGDVVFLATQTDTLNRSEVAENLGLGDDAPLLRVASARNAFTREAVDAAFYEGLDAAAFPENDATFRLAVLAVSASDCQKLEGARSLDGPPKVWTDAEATEVPALRRLLRASAARPRPKESTGALFVRLRETARKRGRPDDVAAAAAAPAAVRTRWDDAAAAPAPAAAEDAWEPAAAPALVCPLSKTRLVDPRTNSICGHTFSLESVQAYFWVGRARTCPVPGCGVQLRRRDFRVDTAATAALAGTSPRAAAPGQLQRRRLDEVRFDLESDLAPAPAPAPAPRPCPPSPEIIDLT